MKHNEIVAEELKELAKAVFLLVAFLMVFVLASGIW